jgi:3-oxoacyl-[acyl-carrier protein] reductase
MSKRVVIITGAAGGLGADMAHHFCQSGHAVACVGRSSARLHALAKELTDAGHDAIAVECDLAIPTQIEAMAETVAQAFGGIDVLVNNAATYKLRPWLEISAEEFDHIISVNQRGCFLTAKACFPYLKKSGTGRVVNIVSNTLFTGWEGLMSYVSSKGGIIGLTRTLAREIGKEGVTVNAVAPGAIPTKAEEHHPDQDEFNKKILDFQSMKVRGTPGDISRAVAYFADEGSGFVTGQTLIVDGGGAMI